MLVPDVAHKGLSHLQINAPTLKVRLTAISAGVGRLDPSRLRPQGQTRGSAVGGGVVGRHTTDIQGGGNMQSVVERNDLDELMAMVG
jgi:hypothetical protein